MSPRLPPLLACLRSLTSPFPAPQVRHRRRLRGAPFFSFLSFCTATLPDASDSTLAMQGASLLTAFECMGNAGGLIHTVYPRDNGKAQTKVDDKPSNVKVSTA